MVPPKTALLPVVTWTYTRDPYNGKPGSRKERPSSGVKGYYRERSAVSLLVWLRSIGSTRRPLPDSLV